MNILKILLTSACFFVLEADAMIEGSCSVEEYDRLCTFAYQPETRGQFTLNPAPRISPGKISAMATEQLKTVIAKKECRVEEVEKLLAEGADPNCVDDQNRSPLWWSASLRRPDLARALLRYKGLNLNTPSKIGQTTPLCAALRNLDIGTANLLLDAGATTTNRDWKGKTERELIRSVIIQETIEN
ncbi:hypothetical protein FACS189472_03060 [Alphaproteobacteria bacterium]|nr:hypothetical protein FACS189472_03060 [Alphaproteobacteria bacterium]